MTDPIDFMRMPAIDVHAHCGTYDGFNASEAILFNAEADEVVARARACGVERTIVSEIGAFDAEPGRPADVDAANRRAGEAAERFEDLRFYVVVNPKREGWETVTDRMLEHPGCAGVKLHPRWHHWSVEEHGDRLFSFLNERRLLTLTHTGNLGNEPERFIPFANRFPHVRLILAHIGHSETQTYDLQINAVKMSTQGNVWADTSSSKSIAGRLIERAVEQVGAECVLFGSDAPLYFTAMQKARIAYALIPDEAKRMILYDNAAGLLGV
jgi:predicted TIM-barrel fold metal-dependent hydrolase